MQQPQQQQQSKRERVKGTICSLELLKQYNIFGGYHNVYIVEAIAWSVAKKISWEFILDESYF
jgi:hypothetical protein